MADFLDLEGVRESAGAAVGTGDDVNVMDRMRMEKIKSGVCGRAAVIIYIYTRRYQ